MTLNSWQQTRIGHWRFECTAPYDREKCSFSVDGNFSLDEITDLLNHHLESHHKSLMDYFDDKQKRTSHEPV